MNKILLSIIFLLGLTIPSHAIVTNTTNQTVLACNGSLTTFQYTFPIIDTANATDLYVYQNDNLGNQTQITTNYSVNTTTGTVTYPISGTTCPSGYQIVLIRKEPFTQGVAASYQGPGPTPPVMNMADKLTMLTQQLNNSSIQSAPGTSTTLMLPPYVAGDLIGWGNSVSLVNIANPSAVAQWSLSGANIYYNTGNVSTSNQMTAAQFNGLLNGNVNWQAISLIASTNVNWQDFNINATLGHGGINWQDMKYNSLNSKGINWNSITDVLPASTNVILNQISGNATNWTSIDALVPTIIVSNTQSSGTGGGSITSGSWQTATLNHIDVDNANLLNGILTSNNVVLPAGTYKVHGSMPLWATSAGINGQIRIYNSTGSAILVNGQNSFESGGTNVGVVSIVNGRFTLASTSTVILQYYASAGSTNGQGVPFSFGTEVYAQVEFTKVS